MTSTGATAQEPVGLTAKGRATRARIVAAAAALTFERGVAGTSTEEIRAAAGVSNSQLYHYFSDKNHLVRAVIVYQTERVLGAQGPLLSRLDSFAALRAWRDNVVGFQRMCHHQGGCPIGSLASELSDVDEGARAALAASFARWEGAIRDGLVALRDRGELRTEADPAQLALATLTALQGGLLLTQVRRDTVALEAGLDAVLAHIGTFATSTVDTAPEEDPVTWAAVVLAGGSGRRLGGVYKPALVVGGRPLLDIALSAVEGADRIVVVGPRSDTAHEVRWSREEPPGGGPVAGLAAGLAEAGDTAEVVVLAADLTGVGTGTVRRLRAALTSAVDGAVLVDDGGHVQWLIGAWRTESLRAALPAEPKGASLRAVLGGLALARVGAHPGEAADLDTPGDLDRLAADPRN